MQDIVYKLVPGLQEGKCCITLWCNHQEIQLITVKLSLCWTDAVCICSHTVRKKYLSIKYSCCRLLGVRKQVTVRTHTSFHIHHWISNTQWPWGKRHCQALIFFLFLLSCSGDKEAEGVLSEVGDGGAWRHQRRALQHEDSSRSAQWYAPPHTLWTHVDRFYLWLSHRLHPSVSVLSNNGTCCSFMVLSGLIW